MEEAGRQAREQEIASDLDRFKRSNPSQDDPKPTQPPKKNQVASKNVSKANSEVTKVTQKNVLKTLGVGLGIFLALTAIVGLLMTTLFVFQHQLFYPATSLTTTTKVSGSKILNIGQLCQWNNQCPSNAYCLITCQCSDSYYFDSVTGTCIQGKTFGVACTNNYECNRIQRLTCIAGICDCEAVELVWYAAYSGGGGIISGRCMKRLGAGQLSNLAAYCLPNMAAGNLLGATSSICQWLVTNMLNFDTGTSDPSPVWNECDTSYECRPDFSSCMNIDGDKYKKCTPFPTVYYNGGFLLKATYGQPCNLYTLCNEFMNLKCSNFYGNSTVTGTCDCYSKYYYYNTTMCVYGTRYGEICTTSTSCVPTTANMGCNVPYSGAGYKVCRCTSGTQYYDSAQEKCTTLKSYNQVCRDSSECRDAYPIGAAIQALGYCGFIPGGSLSVCNCIYNYYSIGGLCIIKNAINAACTTARAVPQCQYNSYCSGGTCICGTGKTVAASGSCQWLGYQTDTCTSGTDCWSTTCTASACT